MENVPEAQKSRKSDPSSDYRLIESFPTRKGEELRVGLSLYMGHWRIDVRTWYEAESGWRPTKKGITLRADRAHEIQQALPKALHAIGKLANLPR